MSEPPGLQSPLGIEAVRWSQGREGDLVVRVVGRWWDRPASTVPPVLVVDTKSEHYRFPARPEAPGVPGAQGGLLQICFTIPAWLAPYLGERHTLLLGSVSISLPPAIADGGAVGGGAAPGGEHGGGKGGNGNGGIRGGEIRARDVRNREFPAGEIRARDIRRSEVRDGALVERLELELERARREAERLRVELDAAERKRREAQQLAHAEAAIRLDRERDHAAMLEHHRANARAPLGLLQASQIHARRLEQEIESLRRSVDEGARPRPAAPWAGSRTRARVLAAELAIAKAAPPAPRAAVVSVAPGNPGLGLELAMWAMPATARPAHAAPGAAYVTDAIDGIARQLDEVREAVASLPALREPERGGRGPDPEADAVVPDRLAAALERLREESAPIEAEPASSGLIAPGEPAPRSSRWLVPALRRLLREDPALAGAVITRLLPAQSLVVADSVRYDIALSDLGCQAVTVCADRVRIELLGAPRPLEGVAFRIEGDLAGLGRLLVYGRIRRRLSRRVARVRGDRRAFGALVSLIREPFALPALYAAGVRLDPELALRLVAEMIDPAWTAGERFTIGHESPPGGGRVYLHVRDRERARVTCEPPLGPVATTIRSPGEELLALLAGIDDARIELRGASAPVALVREWIARAQRDS